MVVQRMRSQGGNGDNIVGSKFQNPNPKSNQLPRQGSLYSLTLDEVQNHLGEPLSSMNLDELLKTVLTVEATRDLSKKTVDELWRDIQLEEKRGILNRNVTFGEMTLEDFLVKAGVVADSLPGKKNPVDLIGLPQQGLWSSFPGSGVPPQQSMMHVYMGGNLALDTAYPDTQIMSLLPLMGTLSDTQTPRQKSVAPDDIAEKSVERRHERMIKNRESAARSRARKQAYTHELENKVSLLEEENERFKKQQEHLVYTLLVAHLYCRNGRRRCRAYRHHNQSINCVERAPALYEDSIDWLHLFFFFCS